MALISLEHVTKEYDGKPVVNDLSLKVDQGELFVLVGTSGSGKTTTLKMINRLVDPTSGVIEFADKPLTSYKMRDLRWDLGCPAADRLVSNHDSGAKHCRDPRNEGLVAPKNSDGNRRVTHNS